MLHFGCCTRSFQRETPTAWIDDVFIKRKSFKTAPVKKRYELNLIDFHPLGPQDKLNHQHEPTLPQPPKLINYTSDTLRSDSQQFDPTTSLYLSMSLPSLQGGGTSSLSTFRFARDFRNTWAPWGVDVFLFFLELRNRDGNQTYMFFVALIFLFGFWFSYRKKAVLGLRSFFTFWVFEFFPPCPFASCKLLGKALCRT